MTFNSKLPLTKELRLLYNYPSLMMRML